MNKELNHYEELDFSRQCELINEAHFRDKADLILRSMSPDLLIPSLVSEDFFLVFSEAGKEFKPELLKHASTNQLLFISDFECWKKDQIDSEKFIHWLSDLFESTHKQFRSWLLEVDVEMLVSSLMGFTKVFKTEHLEAIDDYIGNDPYFTIDNLYYICIDSDDHDIIRQAIEVLYEEKKSLYLQVLEGLICESAYEVTEAAFGWRNQRLALSGFPPKEESIRIFLPIQDWSKITRRDGSVQEKVNKNHSPDPNEWRFPVNLEHDKSFLELALTQVKKNNGELFDKISSEFVALANKVIICENLDFTKSLTLKQSLLRVRRTLSLALEQLANKQLSQAVNILQEYWIEDIFRQGYTYLDQVKKQAIKIYQESSFEDFSHFKDFLNPSLGERFYGLTRFFPVQSTGEIQEDGTQFQEFSKLETLMNEATEIQAADFLLRKFKEILGHELPNIFDHDFSKFNLEIESFNWFALLGNGLVHHLLSKKLSFEPLNVDQVKLFISKVFEVDPQTKKKKIKREIFNSFFEELNCTELNSNTPFIKELTNLIEDELGGIPDNETIVSIYISCLLMEL